MPIKQKADCQMVAGAPLTVLPGFYRNTAIIPKNRDRLGFGLLSFKNCLISKNLWIFDGR